jgi:CRP/FNR family transcriptional regulator
MSSLIPPPPPDSARITAAPAASAVTSAATGDVDSPLLARVRRAYPELPLPTHLDPAPALQFMAVKAGTVLFDEGRPCGAFPLLLSGQVQVARGTPGGRSLALYRLGAGELCVVSASCLWGRAPLSAHGVALQDTELALIDAAGFDAWAADEPFRRHVFGIFAERMAGLMALAEAVAFQRLDQRLAATLLGHGAVLHTTHQALAEELGTVREIVTRLLRRFEQAGWVALGRERIELREPAALRVVAEGRAPDASDPRPNGV